VLRQDLLPYQHQQNKLQHLPVLRDVIKKVRDLGDQLLDTMQGLQQASDSARKFKQELGSKGTQNRWKFLSTREEELRGRLMAIKKRFQMIRKGGEDCDGYTTGSEEELFIGNLNK